MRPPAATMVQTTGNLSANSRSIKMGVDVDNIEHLLMLLTDLYSDQVLAILREYSTNAWDSHVSSGVTRPIEVSLPSRLNPTLKIRDYGSGLSLDDMENVYSRYGTSTKRDNDDANGMFGIGCKSALTYSQQFTVTSVKDGTRITALVSRVGSVATMDIIDTRPTTEHNGVEISVPTKIGDTDEFRTKADYLYGFWKPGTVLVNGVTPTAPALDMVTDNIGTIGGNQFGHDIVVMGNVPYPVGKRLYKDRHYGTMFDIVAFVEIGEVSIPPSREAVMYTSQTETTLERLAGEFAAKIRQTIVDDITLAPTHADAYLRKVKWDRSYPNLGPYPAQYKGQDIPSMLNFPYALYNSNAYSRAYSTGHKNFYMDKIDKSLIIYDFPGLASLSKVYKEKIRKWKDDNGVQASYHMLTLAKEGDPWISPDRMVSWDVIKKVVLPNSGPTGVRKAPTIDIYDTATGYVGVAGLDSTKTPVYVSPTARIGRSEAIELYNLLPDIQIVSLGANRWDKFIRENPKAIALKTFIKDEYDKARDALTPQDLKYISMASYSQSAFSRLDENKLDDPDLVETVGLAKNGLKSATLSKYKSLKAIAYRHGLNVKNDVQVDYSESYPLLQSYGSGTLMLEHTHIYLNAVYADSIKP